MRAGFLERHQACNYGNLGYEADCAPDVKYRRLKQRSRIE